LITALGERALDQPHVRVPLVYGVVASLYIISTTALSGWSLDYPRTVLLVEIAKGLGFVAVTTAVIWFVLWRAARRTHHYRLRFETLVDRLPDAVLLLRLPGSEITYANTAAARMFGYDDASEMVGLGTDALHVDRDHHARFHEASLGDLEAGRPFHGTWTMRRRDGTAFPTSHVVTRIEDVDGTSWSLSVVRDESEFRALEDRALEGESRLHDVARHLNEVFWIGKPDKAEVFYVSPAYERVWGVSVEQLYARPDAWLESVVEEDRDRVAAATRRQAEGTYDEQYRIRRPDGEVRWIRDRATPIHDDDGRVRRIIGIAEDVTEQREREAELHHSRKVEAVGRLTGEVAHDFNNLLTVILGNAEMLAMQLPEDSELAADVDAIRDTARRGAALTQRLLAFARRQHLAPERIETNDLLRDLESDLLSRTIGTGIRLTLELDEAQPAVHVDRSQLENAIVNLAINARDAMPDGGELRIETRVETVAEGGEDDGEYVRISVVDTGFGMPDEVRERIFEPFFTTKAAGEGTGLGLSAVHGFVVQSGGRVRVASEAGVGTRFDLLLPRAD
jgi:PAS domain S-box-containing protein